MQNITTEHTEIEHAEDVVEIRNLMERLLADWAAGDAENYARNFHEDAVYLAFDGTMQVGRAEIVAAHRPLFEKWLKGSRLVGEIQEIRFLAPDVALVLARGNTVLAGKQKPSPDRESVQTLVAVKRNNTWRFTSFQNTRVRPIASSVRNLISWRVADLLWTVLGKSSPTPEQEMVASA